jgi:hypothetical protein
MLHQRVTDKLPTLERLALNRIREQYPDLRRGGFSRAVRGHCAREDAPLGPIGIIPDGWFEKPAGAFICVEVEDHHPLSREKLWLYCELYDWLDACDHGSLRLLVFDRYGLNERELDLGTLYLDGIVGMFGPGAATTH